MPQINELTRATDIADNDDFPMWDASNSDTRRVTKKALEDSIADRRSFATRAALAADVAATPPIHGMIYEADGLQYQGFTGSTVIADLPGLFPCLPYRAAHHGETDGTVTITLKPTGGQFSTPQAAMNYAAGFSPLDTVTIEQDGTVQGSVELLADCSHVIWKAKTVRASLAYADFTAAYAPNWSLGTNDSSDQTTNTLFLATKAAIGAMLRTKYSSIVEVDAGNGVELRSQGLQRIENILFINVNNGQRGISTGESIAAGSGGTVELRGTSFHGFKASGASANYGGSIIAYSVAYGMISTFSCNGDSGIISQYAGASVYAQNAVVYANFQFGIRFKQFGMIYPGEGYVSYNRIDGVSAFMGGQLNGLGGRYQFNGGYGINLFGAGACAEASGAIVSNNIGGGVRSQDGAFAYVSGGTISNNGGIGLYAPSGAINATGATVNANASHAANVTSGGRINVVGATLSNSTNGMGVRIDNGGQIDATNAVIFGNTNAFSRQVFVNISGDAYIAGAVDNLAAPITTANCTPPIGIRTAQGASVINTAVNSTVAVLSETFAEMANASGPALANVAASATVPSVLPNKTNTTQGLSQGSGGEVAIIHTSATQFGVGAAYARAATEYRVGAYPGTKVAGARETGFAAMTGTATKTAIATGSATLVQVAERLKAIDDALRTHGLIGT